MNCCGWRKLSKRRRHRAWPLVALAIAAAASAHSVPALAGGSRQALQPRSLTLQRSRLDGGFCQTLAQALKGPAAGAGFEVFSGGEVVYAGPSSVPWRHPEQPSLTSPLDQGRQGRADLEFALFYLPEVYPGRTFQEMAGEAYLTAPGLNQQGDGDSNPFLLQRDQLRRLEQDAPYRSERLVQGAALAWLYREQGLRPESMLNALLAPAHVTSNELIAGAVVPLALNFLPPLLTGVETGEGQVPVDVAVHTSASNNSAAPLEAMLLSADQHGTRAVVVADQGRIDGAQEARRLAEELQREGRLSEVFTVLIGETIQTSAGSVLGVLLRERIPEGMTLRATLAEIRRQGGLAYLANPAAPGGKRLLRSFDLDGYLVRPGLPETWRTAAIMEDPTLADRAALYGSNSLYDAAAGLPYTVLESPSTRPEDLARALAENRATAVSPLFLPYTVALAYKPIGWFVGTLNRFFEAHDLVEETLTRWLGVDSVRIVTSWDARIRHWMTLLEVPRGVQEVVEGRGPLSRLPRLELVAAEYGDLQLTYLRSPREVWLQTLLTW